MLIRADLMLRCCKLVEVDLKYHWVVQSKFILVFFIFHFFYPYVKPKKKRSFLAQCDACKRQHQNQFD